MSKIAYIIPGFKYSVRRKEYKDVAKLFKERGIKPLLVPIDWNRTTITGWKHQLIELHKKTAKPGDRIYILGFSYGAMTALAAAPELNPDVLFLCSLSPFFVEDLPNIPKKWKESIGTRRARAFAGLSFNKLAKQTESKTFLLAGSLEVEEVQKRFLDAKRKLKNCTPIIVDSARHNLGQPEYQLALKRIIR